MKKIVGIATPIGYRLAFVRKNAGITVRAGIGQSRVGKPEKNRPNQAGTNKANPQARVVTRGFIAGLAHSNVLTSEG
jgi:hypothetical protein